MPVDYKEYHPKWPLIVRLIRRRAGNRCEGCEQFPDCRAENGAYLVRGQVSGIGFEQLGIYPIESSDNIIPHARIVLTTGHIDGDITNNRFWNLKYWCQRCHFSHDRGDNIMRKRYGKKFSRRHQLRLSFNSKKLLMQTFIADKLNEITTEQKVQQLKLINQHLEDIDRMIVELDRIPKGSIHGLTLSGPKLEPVNFYLGEEGSLAVAATMSRFFKRRRSELYTQAQTIMSAE